MRESLACMANDPLENRSFSVVYGPSFVDVNYLHLVASSAKQAKVSEKNELTANFGHIIVK